MRGEVILAERKGFEPFYNPRYPALLRLVFIFVLHFVLHTFPNCFFILVHSGREYVLINLLNHIGRAMPHKLCDIFLWDIQQKQLAGVMVSKSMEIQVRVDFSGVPFTETAPVIRDNLI